MGAAVGLAGNVGITTGKPFCLPKKECSEVTMYRLWKLVRRENVFVNGLIGWLVFGVLRTDCSRPATEQCYGLI